MDIQSMSTLEKIRAMEQLWESLEEGDSDANPPKWHGDVLQERLQAMQENPGEYTSLEEVKKRGIR